MASISANEPLSASCDALRQEPDVGEGWRLLGPEDVLQAGDEWGYGNNPSEWYRVPMHRCGFSTFTMYPYVAYRRRVTTDVPEAPQSRPAETRASSRQHVIDYDRETRNWNERIAKADAELARRAAITSEVARLRAENATLRSGVELLSAEATKLRSEVERLRLTLPAVVCEATKRAIDEIIRQGGDS